MDPIYRKTPRGHEAIANRALGLVGRLRSLLIVVDGQRRQSVLVQLAGAFGDVPQMLAQLQADGYVEVVDGTAAGPAPAAPARAGAAATPTGAAAPPATAPATSPAPGVLALPQLRQFASQQLMQLLGPTADVLCLRLEAARNRQEFIEAMRKAYAAVQDIRGRTEAERFGAAIEQRLPPD